jgi:hypothetical protein
MGLEEMRRMCWKRTAGCGGDSGPGVRALLAYKYARMWWLGFLGGPWVPSLGVPLGQVDVGHFGGLDSPEGESGCCKFGYNSRDDHARRTIPCTLIN